MEYRDEQRSAQGGNREPSFHKNELFFVRPALIQMAHRLQPLEHPFHFFLLFGKKKLIAWRWRKLLPGLSDRFPPELPVRNPIEQGFTRVTAEVAQQARAGIVVASMNQQNPAFATHLRTYGEVYRERHIPTSLIQALYLTPTDLVNANFQVGFVDFNSGAER